MQRILVVMPYQGASFMEEDVRLLARHAAVDVIAGAGWAGTVAAVASMLVRRRPEVVLLWFAHPTYAWLVATEAHLAGVPVAIVTGGYDVACEPEYKFGAMRKPHFRFLVKRALRAADVLLPFSARAARETSRWVEPRAMRVIHPAVDLAVFHPLGAIDMPRAPLVLTVSKVNRLFLRQKGLDTFVKTAALVPEARFMLIGGAAGDNTLDRLRARATPNLEFRSEFLPREELVRVYQQARVYVQASAHEGFGLAAAESMACGATVVGTAGTALEDVVGDTGELIPYGDPAACADAVRRSLATYPSGNARACRRIADHFSLAERERRLVAVLEALARRAPLPAGGPPVPVPVPGVGTHAH